MKRDMNLVRNLLIEIEEWESTEAEPTLGKYSEGVSQDVLYDHLELMAEAGLVKGMNVGGYFQPDRLTWKGHDFLDTVRDEKIWAKTQEKVKSTVGGATIEVIKAVAAEFVKSALFPT